MAQLDELPLLTSQDLEALLAPELGPYQGLEQPAPWLEITTSPGSAEEDQGFGAALGANGATAAAVFDPAWGLFDDLAAGPAVPGFLPLAGAGDGGESMPPLQTDSSDATGSGGLSVAAAAVGAAPQQRRRGGGGGRRALTEEQHERIKAKNRRAQSRYREKQKAKAAEAEAEFHEAHQQLERLRLENEALQGKQAVLQQVLSVRDVMVGALEGGKAAAAGEGAGALPCGCASSAECGCPSPAVGTTAQQAQPLATAHDQDVCPGPSCPLTGLTLSQIAELKSRPPEALQRNWRSIAQRLAGLLQQLEAVERSADATLAVTPATLQQQIETTLQEGQAFCFEHAVYQPTNVQKLFAAALDDGQTALSADDLQHWAAVAEALHLSEEQLERLAAARSRFLSSIAQVCQGRRLILERLAAVEVPDTSSLRSMQHATAAWLQVHEATAELTASMNDEFVACIHLVRDAFGFTLTPMQKAVAIARAYPFFPDSFSIATVALQRRRPDLLEGGAAPGLLAAALQASA